MASLADELLADLEDEEEDIEDEIGLQAGEADIKDEVKMEIEEVVYYTNFWEEQLLLEL